MCTDNRMCAVSWSEYALLYKIKVQLCAVQDRLIQDVIANDNAERVEMFSACYADSRRNRNGGCYFVREAYRVRDEEENESPFVWNPLDDASTPLDVCDWCDANFCYCQFLDCEIGAEKQRNAKDVVHPSSISLQNQLFSLLDVCTKPILFMSCLSSLDDQTLTTVELPIIRHTRIINISFLDLVVEALVASIVIAHVQGRHKDILATIFQFRKIINLAQVCCLSSYSDMFDRSRRFLGYI